MDAETTHRFDKLDDRLCGIDELLRGTEDGKPGMLEVQRGHFRWLASNTRDIRALFTQPEIAAMIPTAPGVWWESLIRLTVTSGLRLDEMANPHWRDVDLERGTVTVTAKEAETIAIDERQFRSWSWKAKAQTSYRTVPLVRETIDVLQRQRLKMGASPFVFITTQRLAVLQSNIDATGRMAAEINVLGNPLRQFKIIQANAAKATGGDWRIGSIHDMRRTYCTRLAEQGVPLHVLKRYAGHSTVAVTEQFYLGLGSDMDEKVRRALSAAG